MDVLILNQDLTLKQVLSSWEYFSFTQKLNAKGLFSLLVNANSPEVKDIHVGQLIYFSPTMCGYITKKEITSESDKQSEKMEISGIALKDAIASRITYPPEGQEAFNYKKKTTEAIVFDLINQLLVNPGDERKKIPIFRLGNKKGYGTEQDFSTRLKALDTQIYELLVADKLGLRCSVNLNNKLATFSVYKGVNRTINQKKNAPVLFSLELGTLGKAVTLQDITTYRNVGIVGGEGEGVNRVIMEVPKENKLCGLDRWETFIDISDAKTEDELWSRGISVLAEYDKTYSIDGGVRNAGDFILALGDYVTILDNQKKYQNVQVTEMTRSFDANHVEKQSITFGKAPATIGQAINRKLSGLNNILTK